MPSMKTLLWMLLVVVIYDNFLRSIISPLLSGVLPPTASA